MAPPFFRTTVHALVLIARGQQTLRWSIHLVLYFLTPLKMQAKCAAQTNVLHWDSEHRPLPAYTILKMWGDRRRRWHNIEPIASTVEEQTFRIFRHVFFRQINRDVCRVQREPREAPINQCNCRLQVCIRASGSVALAGAAETRARRGKGTAREGG